MILTLLTQAIRKRKQPRKTRKKIAVVAETAQMTQCLIAVVMRMRNKTKVMILMMKVLKMVKALMKSQLEL